jgi:hypothetical protein
LGGGTSDPVDDTSETTLKVRYSACAHRSGESLAPFSSSAHHAISHRGFSMIFACPSARNGSRTLLVFAGARPASEPLAFTVFKNSFYLFFGSTKRSLGSVIAWRAVQERSSG